jgi:hypothetical protein
VPLPAGPQPDPAATGGVSLFENVDKLGDGVAAESEAGVAGTKRFEGRFQGGGLPFDFGQGGFCLRQLRQQVHAHLLRGVDELSQFLLPAPARCQFRYGRGRLGSSFPGGPGGFHRFGGIGVAVLAGENGDQLPGLGELRFQCRQRPLGRLAALHGPFLFLGKPEDGVPGGNRLGVLRAPADGTGRPVFQARSQFGRRIDQAFLADVQPLPAQFLVVFPAFEVPLPDGSAPGPSNAVAPDNVHQLVGGRRFLCAQHRFPCQLFKRLQGCMQGLHLGTEGKQPDGVVISGPGEFMPPLCEPGGPCMQATQLLLIGQAFADHSGQRPQPRKLRGHVDGGVLGDGAVFHIAVFRSAVFHNCQFGARARGLPHAGKG